MADTRLSQRLGRRWRVPCHVAVDLIKEGLVVNVEKTTWVELARETHELVNRSK
jgi:hypothetical protein